MKSVEYKSNIYNTNRVECYFFDLVQIIFQPLIRIINSIRFPLIKLPFINKYEFEKSKKIRNKE